jgi:hypothetical protein
MSVADDQVQSTQSYIKPLQPQYLEHNRTAAKTFRYNSRFLKTSHFEIHIKMVYPIMCSTSWPLRTIILINLILHCVIASFKND